MLVSAIYKSTNTFYHFPSPGYTTYKKLKIRHRLRFSELPIKEKGGEALKFKYNFLTSSEKKARRKKWRKKGPSPYNVTNIV